MHSHPVHRPPWASNKRVSKGLRVVGINELPEGRCWSEFCELDGGTAFTSASQLQICFIWAPVKPASRFLAMCASWLMDPQKRMCVVCRAAAKKRRLDQHKSLFCTRFCDCLNSAAV